MEAEYLRDRVRLWQLRREHAEWTYQQLAHEIGRSRSWVKKWLKRFQKTPPEQTPRVFLSRAMDPAERAPRIQPEVIARILEIRDHPPENLRRTPGPKAILYYLHRQQDLIEAGYYLPTSTRTIWKILVAQGRIAHRLREHEPLERLEPNVEWQADFKDISSVLGDPAGGGKRQHAVEALNVVDAGTSRVIDSQVRADYNAETSLIAFASLLLRRDCPQRIRFDRDPRFVGSWTGKDFPSPLMKFLLCVGVEVVVTPPHRPDKNPFVERFHRCVQEEYVAVERPGNLEQALDGMEAYVAHYNGERPSQALSCGNQPPTVAFPELRPLPSLPTMVDPDAWLRAVADHVYTRRVTAWGSIQIGDHDYYIRKDLAGHKIALVVQAERREFAVYDGKTYIRQLPIKGLQGKLIPFGEYLKGMCEQARTLDRRLQYRRAA